MRLHLATLLDDLRRIGPGKAVVRHIGNRRNATTYEEIANLAGRFATLLSERNIGPGDRVVLWAENSAEWIAAFYGCMLRGVLTVPLDAHGSPEFAARVASDVRPSLIVGDSALLVTLPTEWPKLPFDSALALNTWAATLPPSQTGPIPDLSRDTPLQILFTSGTTGEPKGVVHTHGNVLASIEPIEQAARGYMRYERPFHPLRFLHTLPMSHVFGQTMGMWIPPIFAAEVHFEDRLTASRLIETIHRERISVFIAVPRILAILKTHLETEYPNLPTRLTAAQGISAAKRWWRFRDIHSAFGLKFWTLITGGGALPAPIEQFWNSLGFVLVQGYGMTETAALITLNHPFHVARGTMGKPLPGREVKLQPDGEVLVRGPMISPATWSGGALHQRTGEWLATGDLAEAQPTGELRFLGRKSETIVTATGLNIHPEDIEAVLEQEPEVAASAVVPIATPLGPEPCAVLALRSAPEHAAAIIQSANTRLAEFQRIRRWALWPGPDLPRTSTGKIKRPAVIAWLTQREANNANAASPATTDWLLSLISQITGEHPPSDHNAQDLRLSENLHLDSLGQVQLLEALEERLGISLNQNEYDAAETLGDLRRLTTHPVEPEINRNHPAPLPEAPQTNNGPANTSPETPHPSPSKTATNYIYPQWPWLLPLRWLRTAFTELAMRPLVWLLAAPRIVRTPNALPSPEPMLIIANHVTAYDVPLLLYALPRAIRDRTAAAMSAEMLDDYLHARNQQPRWLNPLGPLVWLLITALFNVFPLPRRRDFQRSFAHAGQALDRGFHVIVFPEGTRSPDGALANFRPGIGLLVKQSFTAVLPIALHGLGDLKTRRRSWFRSGALEIRVGQPIHLAANDSEATITARLHEEMEKLLTS